MADAESPRDPRSRDTSPDHTSDDELRLLCSRIIQVLDEVEAIAAEGRTDAVEGPATIGGIRSALARDVAKMLQRVLDGKEPL